MKKVVIVSLILVALLVVGVTVYRSRVQKISSPLLGELPIETTETLAPSDSTGEASSAPIQTGTTPVPREITLSVSSPSNNSTVRSAAVTVRGKTVPNAEVFINESETRADASGNFSYAMTLDEGENILVVLVNDEVGNVAQQELAISYLPN